MLEPAYATWPDNAVLENRQVVVGRPWAPSPEPEPAPLPSASASTSTPRETPRPAHSRHASTSSAKRDSDGASATVEDDPARQQSSRWASVLRRCRFGKKKGKQPEGASEGARAVPPPHEERRIVTPVEWRAYGYWARPIINDVTVRNATPPPVPPGDVSEEEVAELMENLKHERAQGIIFSDKWVARVQHPSLPPRPALWDTPPAGHAALPSTALELNPFLRHRTLGQAPVLFDMRLHQHLIWLGELPPAEPGGARRRVKFGWEHANGAQPATHPPVRALTIRALADDPCARWPWPVVVLPHHPGLPVLVAHVFNALIANFEERMTRAEVDALGAERRRQTFEAYWLRVRTMVAGRLPGDDDGVRRIDYLGDRPFFRGLEPAPDGDGFILFVGPP